jgi:hypothetical protein
MGAPVTASVRQRQAYQPSPLADARMAFVLLNHARHVTLERVFGIQRSQANLLTGILALGAAHAAYDGARRAAGVRHSFRLRNQRFTILLAREAVYALGGPTAREIPGFPLLVGGAVAASFGLPAARRVAHDARRTNHRLRELFALRVGRSSD